DFTQAAEQARKAAQLAAQPADVRAGLDLIRAEAFSGRADAGEEEVVRQAAREWREFWLDHPEHPAAQEARKEEARLSELASRRLPARRYQQSGKAEEAAYLAARLQLDQGHEADARRRLARLARRRTVAHASDARWTLAWLSYRRGLPDAAERFAEFTASADSDPQRAQGLYWRSRVTEPRKTGAFDRRNVEVDPLGIYELIPRQRPGQEDSEQLP